MNDGSQLKMLNWPTTAALQLSLDGSKFAYRDKKNLIVKEMDGSLVALFKDIWNDERALAEYEFLEADCLVIYDQDRNKPINQVALRRICVGDKTPQVLATVDFPGEVNLVDIPTRVYRLSPQGDKLLAYIQSFLHGPISLYLKELRNDESPRLVFQSPTKTCTQYWYQFKSPFRWRSDGETIDLLWSSFCDGRAENVFYQTDWKSTEFKQQVTISDILIDIGSWSPNGREFVFSYKLVEGNSLRFPDGTRAGLYVLDFNSKTWQQIVPEFYIDYIPIKTTWR